MKTFRIIATIVMSAAFAFFGMAKIVQAELVTDAASWDRLSETSWLLIGLVEIAAVVGLLLALAPRFRALGVAAAAGLVALTVSALIFHVSNGDGAGDFMPAVVQGLIAAAYVAVSVRDLRAGAGQSAMGAAS